MRKVMESGPLEQTRGVMLRREEVRHPQGSRVRGSRLFKINLSIINEDLKQTKFKKTLPSLLLFSNPIPTLKLRKGRLKVRDP